MNREQLLGRIDKAWRGFLDACEGVPEDGMEEPGVVGEWSAKDLMGHVSTWEEETLNALGAVMRGGRLPRYSSYGGIDVFNDQKWREHRTESLARVRRRLTETHQRLLDLLGTVPEAHFATETRFRRRLRLDTYGHYPEHAEHLRVWRQSRAFERPRWPAEGSD